MPLTPQADETGEVSPRPSNWVSPDAPTPPSANKPPSDRIGRFKLGDWLGGGGYGEVYKAYDPRLDRDVALKILKPTKLEAKATERFLREARASARLEHPFIVGLHDAGQDDGRLWIAYQLVRGKTLSQLRDKRSLDLRAAVLIVRDLAEAIDHAHRRGITHRDLKPANVIIDDEGRPHLTDFGLARRIDLQSELTGEGTVLGTPAYMSPEQAAGRANAVDGRSDIYSLGVILYELICGRRPSDVPSNTPYWKVQRKEPPPAPHSLNQMVPAELDRICMKALALNPDDRFPTARAMAQALDQWQKLDQTPVPPKSKSRKGVALALAGLVVVAGLGAFAMQPGKLNIAASVSALNPIDNHEPGKRSDVSPVVLDPKMETGGPKDFEVVVNLETHKVHLPTCPSAKKIRERNQRKYSSLAEAKAAGLTDLCGTCGPKMPRQVVENH